MPVRKPGESISQFAIRTAWETGHFWSPDNPDGRNIKQSDLKNLKPSDPVVVKALMSFSKFDVSRYTRHVTEVHGRAPNFDGELGPAMEKMIEEPNGRCPVPDYVPPVGTSFTFTDPDLQKVVERMQLNLALPAIGSGNWPGCNSIGNFHCAAIGVNTSGLPAFLKPLFTQVLKNVQIAYAGVGLLFLFIENGKDILTGKSFSGPINSDMSFVNSSDGWIGLAIVGQNESCSSKIWCKFLNTYRGGSTDAAIVQQWTTLIKHELGHNCGRSHTSGGVMNPSIVNGLPTVWGSDDPSTNWLKGQFGGVAVPIPGGGDVPVPPNPPMTVEERLKAMELKNAIQDAQIKFLIEKVLGS